VNVIPCWRRGCAHEEKFRSPWSDAGWNTRPLGHRLSRSGPGWPAVRRSRHVLNHVDDILPIARSICKQRPDLGWAVSARRCFIGVAARAASC